MSKYQVRIPKKLWNIGAKERR